MAEAAGLELLECARYGELEGVEELLALPAGAPDINFADAGGNTALHRACANGHLEVVRLLVRCGASYTANGSGNSPLHWAVLNKGAPIVKQLLKRFPEADVLATNAFGKSALSEAFVAQDTDVLCLLLEHKSAKGLEPEGAAEGAGGAGGEGAPASGSPATAGTGAGAGAGAPKRKKKRRKKKAATTGVSAAPPPQAAGAGAGAAGDDSGAQPAPEPVAAAEPGQQGEAGPGPGPGAGGAEAARVVQTVDHAMDFSADGSGPRITCREVATDWTGTVFAKTGREDTTGMQLWATSLVFSRFIVERRTLLDGARVCELGAGCGLPGIVAGVYTGASQVLLTDYFAHTIDNLKHNADVNNPAASGKLQVAAVDWMSRESWPEEGGFDVLLGCDLVYDAEIVPALLGVVSGLIRPGGTLLYCSGGMRHGAGAFIKGLAARGFAQEAVITDVPPAFKANPLCSQDDEQLLLHFNELEDNTQTLYQFSAPPPAS